ncbi:MAG: hypothetical protein D8M58_07150 [Calditrichaeota bacterium]|nr:MAG: hypothetical protein DWQ03_19350 [Calditrichota bacterium]MBL1205157.1 hypothetical protein [Calditrichota bacterium]NOG44987.1 hypothetical protein [Calditrichota bacterium]
MGSPDILSICISAIITVFLILGGLAVSIQIITRFFPFRQLKEDTTIYAAITTSHAAIYPGTKITKIEEIK